jgi:RNA polymerase sigma-54 factor
MRFDASQHMSMGQHMKLAPRMIQSMEILQMPLLQLEERIAQELESNVTLEADEHEPDMGPDAGGIEGSGQPEAAADDPDLDGPADAAPDADIDADAASDDASDMLDGARSEDEAELSVDERHGTDDFARLDSFEQDVPDLSDNEYSDAARRETEFDPADRRSASRLEGEPDAKAEAMANTASRPEGLTEQLQEQWAFSEVEPALRPLGEAIIAHIESDGYLRTPLQAIIDRLPTGADERPTPERMEQALQAVQLMLEPAGTGARDTRECLLLQIDAHADQAATPEDREGWRVVRRLVSDHLDDLAQNRLPRVAEKTGLSLPAIKQAMERMRHLHLAPARQLVSERPGVIVPDAIIEHDADQDRYIAYLNDTRLPNLRVNQEYARLARAKDAPPPTREFLKKNLSNALWLIDALEQRRRTLLRVINVVVDAQRDYFDYGPQALKPLPMTQVAQQLGIHVATVSRAVADKHVLTPRGVVPLRGFFTGGTQTDTGEDVSWDAIKAALKDVVDAEDKSAPLSDDALADALKARGVEIARRTVAKYRDQLNIPAARLRKKF